MTEELKYKVGDKVLVEVYVDSVGGRDYPYGLVFSKTGEFISRFSEDELDKVAVKFPPKVTQAVMDWYEEYENKRADWRISDWLSDINTLEGMDDWLYGENHLHNQHALATLIAYGPEAVEVEKEKRYRVKIKGAAQVLAKRGNSYLFEIPNPYDKDGEIYSLANQELIDAGFEGVFDNPMFEVEEVE